MDELRKTTETHLQAIPLLCESALHPLHTNNFTWGASVKTFWKDAGKYPYQYNGK